MNVVHAFFIKNSSAITFILTGVLLKDILIVIAGAMVLGDLISPMQIWGFGMQLIGILMWSLMKAGDQWEELQSDSEDSQDFVLDHEPNKLIGLSSKASDASSE